MRISSPISTVNFEHRSFELAALAKMLYALGGASDKSRSAAVVLRNRPIGVRQPAMILHIFCFEIGPSTRFAFEAGFRSLSVDAVTRAPAIFRARLGCLLDGHLTRIP